MQHALQLARRAEQQGEVPVGAVVVRGDEILGEGWNCPIASSDPTAHAELVAMRSAGSSIGNYRLADSTLYVTLEPCAMCVGAIVHARISRLVFGASDPKAGAVQGAIELLTAAHFNHCPAVEGGILERECASLLIDFFRTRRAQ